MSTFKVTKETALQIQQYESFLIDHEYSKSTVDGYKTYLSRFLRWPSFNLKASLFENINNFLRSEQQNHPCTLYECRPALRRYYEMMKGEAYPSVTCIIESSLTESILKDFFDFSVHVKHIRIATAESEISHVRRFLLYTYKSKSYTLLNELTAYDIRTFIVNELANLSASSKGRMVTSIRNFFRYMKFIGNKVHESIFRIPLSPAVWKQSAFPTTLDLDLFKQLSDMPNLETATGKRDQAIILCFTELALRCIEVASLSLDDFDWYSGLVTVKNTKSHVDRKLPLSSRLGTAIITYLEDARPRTDNRILFVRFKHQCGESMGREQIRGVIRRTYAKVGIDSKITGTHILRRTAATKIYNSGNSLKLTADILGHQSLNSTVFYIKADIVNLSSVAVPWPGGDWSAN
jgi:site-specific recombinase XerD